MAVEAGLPPGPVDRVLASDEFADDVRRGERRVRELGARGVPFFLFPGGATVSGAEPAPVFRAALRGADGDRPRQPTVT